MPFYFRKECPLNSGYLNLLRKSRKEARRAGRKQKRWEGACKALQELNKYRDLINELSE
ncbi:hypothetical protein OkiPb00368_39880 [Escherichia coli]